MRKASLGFSKTEARARRPASSKSATYSGPARDLAAKNEGRGEPPTEGESNPSVDLCRQKRTNQTHQPTTDLQARLVRKSKGTAALLCDSGHALLENRNGLRLDIAVVAADVHAERNSA